MKTRPVIRCLAGLALLAVALPGASATATESCTSHTPFAELPGASLSPTVHISKDAEPVTYVMWRGTVPSFDGMPVSVDVTIPCAMEGPLPLVVMNHGWTDDKTIWEETGRSDTVSSTFRRGSNHHWNNIWFASRGYAVLNHTLRGWHDSCGPRTPNAIPGVVPTACAGYDYWVHLADQRWEIRDVQWLTAALVETGVAASDKLAVTGGSYGGGVTIQAALLADRVMCGAKPMPASLGTDPCAGKAEDETVPWTTRTGVPLKWAVAVPMYTWGDLIQVLLPNGRGSDGHLLPHGDTTDPIGIPIQSYIAGLYAAGQPLGNGYYAPPGVDPTADITLQSARVLAGNPFRREDPLIANGLRQFRHFKSAIEITPGAVVPIFWVQGFTDPLFTAFEPLQIANKLRATNPDYPISMFFGDLGHDYASERVDEWDAAHEQMNAFLDHYLTGAGATPPRQVTAAITRCFNHDDPMDLRTAASWEALSRPGVILEGSQALARTTPVTSSHALGSMGFATDPVTGASIPGPQAYKGCRIVRPAQTDPGVAAWSWTITHAYLLGAPRIDVRFTTTAPDTQLSVRLWDVEQDGSAQALVTRGTYRSLDGPGTGLVATFQLAPTGYHWKLGNAIRLEITGNDAPYRQTSNVPAVITIEDVKLRLPAPPSVACALEC